VAHARHLCRLRGHLHGDPQAVHAAEHRDRRGLGRDVTFQPLLLFLIIFAWTPPHFWALALYRRKEYERAGVPMLPVTHGEAFTRLHLLLYTLMLVATTLLPFATQMSGFFYLGAALILDAVFLAYAVAIWRRYSDALARKTFAYSIFYLAALFAALMIDHYLPLLGA
jgi:protoheme IX farnesyltransferase